METKRLKPREQGDLGELSAMEWLVAQGARIYMPVFHSPDVDIIAELGSRLFRIQVKTCTYEREHRWCVQVATCGGNQSWNGTVKRLDPSRYDLLFVLVGDGRRWCIPADAVEASTNLTLGASKYSEFEVSTGQPIVPRVGSRIDDPSPGERRSGRAGPDCKFGGQVLSGFESLLPHQSPQKATSAQTRVSKHHQITIPGGPFKSSRIQVGEPLRVTSAGPGRLVVTRIETPRHHS